MKRKLVIGDIHGGLIALKQVLERSNISDNDELIFLGDYVDGWSDTPKVLDFLIELENKVSCIFIKGNHDVNLLTYLKNNEISYNWLPHGGSISVTNYKNISSSDIQNHIKFLEKLKAYYIDNDNRLFIHAGFSHVRGVENEYYESTFYLDRTLWETAVSLDTKLNTDSLFYPRRFKNYKEIYIGHTPTIHIGSSIPTQKNIVWNIDTGAAFTGKLSIMDIDSKEFWQSDSLPSLYPKEKGRNT